MIPSIRGVASGPFALLALLALPTVAAAQHADVARAEGLRPPAPAFGGIAFDRPTSAPDSVSPSLSFSSRIGPLFNRTVPRRAEPVTPPTDATASCSMPVMKPGPDFHSNMPVGLDPRLVVKIDPCPPPD
jgi:hypothetical protein